jgi:hypothetical protein
MLHCRTKQGDEAYETPPTPLQTLAARHLRIPVRILACMQATLTDAAHVGLCASSQHIWPARVTVSASAPRLTCLLASLPACNTHACVVSDGGLDTCNIARCCCADAHCCRGLRHGSCQYAASHFHIGVRSLCHLDRLPDCFNDGHIVSDFEDVALDRLKALSQQARPDHLHRNACVPRINLSTSTCCEPEQRACHMCQRRRAQCGANLHSIYTALDAVATRG